MAKNKSKRKDKPVTITLAADGTPAVKLSPEMELAMVQMRERVENMLANLEGVKQAAVMYLMGAYGKNVNDRQMKRVTRSISQPELMENVVTKERFDYTHNGFTQTLGTFTTITPAIKGANFELRFEAGFPLTKTQEQDIEKILNYKHPGLWEGENDK